MGFRKFFIIASTLVSAPSIAKDFNDTIMEAIKELPAGGKYESSAAAAKVIKTSVNAGKNSVSLDVKDGPMYCSGATYFALIKALEIKKQKLDDGVSQLLHPLSNTGRWQYDGHGVWGRWNANGPGTAMLVKELDLGYNFKDDTFSHAKAGDFLKIFWTNEVGKKERGHSVVFTGVKPKGATGSLVKEVCYWSANQGLGYSTKCTSRSKIKGMIFSRITKPENMNNAAILDKKNDYLAGLLSKTSSYSEAFKLVNGVIYPQKNSSSAGSGH